MSGAQWWESSGRDARAMQPADNYIAGVHGPFPTAGGGAGGGPIPNPLPVTMTQTPTAWVDDQRPEIVGPATIAWPPDAVAYSIQVLAGEATLVGCPSGDVSMVEGDRRTGGLPDGAEESDTLTAWAELQVAADGRVLLAFTLRS
jgi:hypothetical protein